MKNTTFYSVLAGAALACVISTPAAGMRINSQIVDDSRNQSLAISTTTEQGTSPGAEQDTIINSVVTDVVESISTMYIPVPPALLLFGSGLLGLIVIARKRK